MSRERCYDYDHENGFPRVSGDEPCLIAARAMHNGFPRVSGDEPKDRTMNPLITSFSPRERG